jgi:hypothetical protein
MMRRMPKTASITVVTDYIPGTRYPVGTIIVIGGLVNMRITDRNVEMMRNGRIVRSTIGTQVHEPLYKRL